MSKKLNSYTVGLRLDLYVDVEVQAKNLDEVVEKAKALDHADAVEVLGALVDSNVRIASIYVSE